MPPDVPIGLAPLESVSEADRLRQELKAVKKTLEQYRKKDVTSSVIEQVIATALGNVPARPGRAAMTAVPADDEAHHRHVLLLSDFHGGERVDTGAVHGLNVYDWEVQERRVDEVLAACLSHKRRSPALTGLDVLLVGDMCSGSIHKEIAETNQYGPAEQAVRMGHLIADIIGELARHYPEVRVKGVVGNHGRIDKAPAAKEIHQNWDWVAYKLAEALLAPVANVSCSFPSAGSLIHRVAGRNVYVWHGDGVRSSMPGVPWGGVMRRCNEIARQHAEAGVRIDHFVLGHFHQANVVQRGRVLMNGSLKGLDEWVMKCFGGGDPPVQLLLEFDEKRERMTTTRWLTPQAGLGDGAVPLAEAA